MTDAGLWHNEVTRLKVGNVGAKALRLRGKEDRDRTVPITKELAAALKPFIQGKSPDDPVLGIKGKERCITWKKILQDGGKARSETTRSATFIRNSFT